MKHCGRRFHQEVGKFRFLNEIIKVISPKVCAPLPLNCGFVVVKMSFLMKFIMNSSDNFS